MFKQRVIGALVAVLATAGATVGLAAPAQASMSLSLYKQYDPSLVGVQNYFEAYASTTCGYVNNYKWDFGDGTASSTASSYVYKTWDEVGDYPVKVTVTSSCGESVSTSFTQNIYVDDAPVASFDTSISSTNPLKVFADPANTVDNDATSNGSKTPVGELYWNWGDGTSSSTYGTSNVAAHTYARSGTYTITLDAYDTNYNWNSSSRTTRTVTVGTSVPTVTTYDDSDPKVSYTGLWGVVNSAAFYGGSKHYSTTVGNTASFAFTGTKVAYIATKNSTGGSIAVFIDGVKKTTVSTNSATTTEQATIWTSGTLTRASHTLKLKLVSGKRINVDAFKVTS